MKNKLKLLSYLILINLSQKMISINKDVKTNLSKSANNIVSINTVKDNMKNIIKKNIISNDFLHPLKSIDEYTNALLLKNKELYLSKSNLISKAKLIAKELLKTSSLHWPEKKLTKEQLNQSLKNILEGYYTPQNEIKAAKLIILGANPNMTVHYSGPFSRKYIENLPILIMITKSGEFKNLLDLLMLYGANPNITNKYGITPLMIATYQGKEDLVNKLLKYNANVNAQSRSKRTALMWAAENDSNNDIVKILLDKGAKIDIKNKKNHTARDIARRLGNEQIVKLIDLKTEETKKRINTSS